MLPGDVWIHKGELQNETLDGKWEARESLQGHKTSNILWAVFLTARKSCSVCVCVCACVCVCVCV
jgi:hypothetical protein